MHTDHDREQYQILLFMYHCLFFTQKDPICYYIGYGFVFAEARSSHHIINDYMTDGKRKPLFYAWKSYKHSLCGW